MQKSHRLNLLVSTRMWPSLTSTSAIIIILQLVLCLENFLDLLI